MRDQLAGVTYHDPDGQLAYCYNSETASVRLEVQERSSGAGAAGGPLRTLTSSRARATSSSGSGRRSAGLELLTT